MTDIDLTAAVEAAARVEWDNHWELIGRAVQDGRPPRAWEDLTEASRCEFRRLVRPQVEAAALYIAAQALRDAAEGVGSVHLPEEIAIDGEAASIVRGYLRCRADILEAGQ